MPAINPDSLSDYSPVSCGEKTDVTENNSNSCKSETISASTSSVRPKNKSRAGSVRSSSDGAVEAMEGANDDTSSILYRTVSESDKNERALKNEELLKENGHDSSEAETEGPDSPIDNFDGVNFIGDGNGPQVNNDIQAGLSKQRTISVAEVKEMAYARLQQELLKAQQELKLKDEEVEKLSRIREEVSAELEDLTASLFQEAHNMVREANIKEANAQKLLKEANLKIEVLQAEVQALKTLVITSTPSMPNPKLHPQIEGKSRFRRGFNNTNGTLSKRSPSNYELKYKEDTPPRTPEKENQVLYCTDLNDDNEVDPICHKEFLCWKKSPEVDKSCPFISRIYQEDITPCLSFQNTELAEKVIESIENNSIIVEAVSGNNPFPKKCMLLDTPRLCKYKMKFGNDDHWYHISQLCRNRIASVCELMCYFQYIKQGLVRNPVNDVYWEIMRRRKEITLSRLGIGSTT